MKEMYKKYIELFSKLRVLVIGEAFLDVYHSGQSDRICREAPVPVVAVSESTYALGGAGNTVMNVRTLGAQVHFLTVIGNDRSGDNVMTELEKQGIQRDAIFTEENRQTIAKERVMADSHMLARFDRGTTTSITEETEQKIVEYLIDHYDDFDAIIVSDYGYGILTDKVITTLQKLQKYIPQILVVDAKNVEKYQNVHATAVKPNYGEVIILLGAEKESGEERIRQITNLTQDILQQTGADIAAVTLDKEGGLILEHGKNPYRIYAEPTDHSQAIGAGDTFTSAFTLALASAARVAEAAEIASMATKIITKEQGTTTCSQAALLDAYTERTKITQSLDELIKIVKKYRKEGKRIVFTNGCFDILHSGHVTYLQEARKQGDVLIMGVNSDASIKRIKGPERPINTLDDRMKVLAGLGCVDHLISFETNTPIPLIEAIKPDIYVKGGDYTRETLPETAVVEGYGGEVKLIPFVSDRSTTKIIAKIRTQTAASLSAK